MEMIEMTTKKRVGIVINASIYDKLKFVAGKYGMTVNSLMAYVLGQWADSFYAKEKMTDKVIQETKQVLLEIAKNEVNEFKKSKKQTKGVQ